MKLADRREFFRRLQSVNPKPETELDYDSAFENYKEQKLKKALVDINKAIEKDASKSTYYILKARIYLSKEDHQEWHR